MCASLFTPLHRVVYRSRGAFVHAFSRLSALALAAIVLAGTTAFGANIIHEFYVPLPEAQVRTALQSIEPATGIVGTTIESVVSIVITGTGTVVHYDQWEDGYEIDLNNPAQSTTQVWGDGNDANGKPPGYANDPASFSAGAVIVLRNQIPLPRNPANLFYDGRDRFGGTKALVVSRASWATTPGTVLCGANEVMATMDYGTSYIAPVGDDVAASSMFEFVGLFVMARDDGTQVTIDTDGTGPLPATVVALNRGESYLVNGAVKKGATVTSTKPVQVDLITGDIGARYESRRFTLYPVDQWSSTTYAPLGTASNGDTAFAFLYNPNPGTITINVLNNTGTASFTIAPGSVYQYTLAKDSGSKFTCSTDLPFFGIVTVGASTGANNVHDWGFSMLPSDNLTTEAVVGWGPGSSDLTQNGSPVWVTPVAATRIYVDYNGDHLGSLTDPNGQKYDAHYDVAALATKIVYDPDKDQTAMRLYTLSGTPIAAAWGQDPAVAGAANPFLDCGTTVLPFPVPVLKKSSVIAVDNGTAGLTLNDVLEYSITVDNRGLLPLGNLLVLDPLHVALSYVPGTTKRDGVAIPDSPSGTLFPLDESGYTVPIILRSGTTTFTYRATVIGTGSITNTASNPAYNLVVDNNVVVPPGGGSTPCTIAFTNVSGVDTTAYSAGSSVYATLTDPDSNVSASVAEQVTATVTNPATGDVETITLVETGVNTGVFRNTTPLATSASTGAATQNGTLLVAPGNTLTVTHLDTQFGETCSDTAVISVPTQNKYLYLDDPGQSLNRVDPANQADGTTASTGALSLSSSTITVASTTTSNSTTGTTLTFSHTPGTGDNRLLLVSVGVGFNTNNGNAPAVSSVTFGGTAMTLVGTVIPTTTQGTRAYIYSMVNPPSAAANVVVTTASTASMGAGATTFNNVHQTTPLGTFASNSSNGATAISTSVSSALGELVYSVGAWDEGSVNETITADAGQTELWNQGGVNFVSSAASTKPGAAGTVTVGYSAGDNQECVVAGVSIKPAPATGSASTSFTQALTFASSFTLPVGAAPVVQAYYSVTSGSMPGTPSITAVLKRGATTVATSSSAAASGGVLTFTFPALGSALTFNAGEAVTLEITTAQSGVAFTIDFDSSTKPSKITLPTTTVIAVDSLGVYDAPYPGGALITTPSSGTTVYVRSTASDPFGHADITGMGLSIDGPGTGGDLSTTLGAGQVVATTTGTKTYEYPWTVGLTTGAYNIAVTAQEGTEGIQATAATTVTVTQMDLGTPSTTEFTTGLNGPGTPTYAGNETVFVRVTDLDQNTNSLVAETITVVITSLSGDQETRTLTETGPDTGIFVGSVPASTSGGLTPGDGTLHAILGEVLQVVYVDPDDSSDTSNDTATIPNTAPAISVNKTLLSPADGQAMMGETLEYRVQVTNTGNSTLSTVSLVDTFPAAKLGYVSATVAPNTVASGSLTWTNVGPLSPGQSITLDLTFTALASAAPAVNTATANAGGGVTGSDTANVTLTRPALTIAKTLVSPTPGPASIGDDVVFQINVQNTGDTTIPVVPLEDTYSGAAFDFVSAQLAPSASGSGSLLWLDVTSGAGLAPAASVNFTVTLRARGAAAPASNVAAVNYAVDDHGDPVPPASGTATITLLAATISGHVYDDVDQSVTFNGGDSALQDITVSLYSDPNGDGNPADGTLVAVTTTGADGAYEFVNLPVGSYVVVESQPPGYSSSGDTQGANDNRIAVEAATLTAFSGNDFFDFLTAPVSYASITGTVWNDANSSATTDVGETGITNVQVDLVEDTNGNGSADPGEPVISSTLTATDGTYSFTGLSAGTYVVVERDLFGWYSTADASGANNNQVPATLSAGQNLTGRDFLDVYTGSTGGRVYRDVNANGSYDPGTDTPLANVDVIVTDVFGVPQTVVTDVNGSWAATVPPGLTTVDVQQADPQFAAAFPTGELQTEGTDSSTVTVVASVSTPAGNDGFRPLAVLTGRLYLDSNGNGTQDPGEPGLADVDVIVKDSNDVLHTVTTDGTGDWLAPLIPGSSQVNVDETDPDFTSVVLTGPYQQWQQTQGNDPTTVTAVADVSTSGGVDGYHNPTIVQGHVFLDTNGNGVQNPGEPDLANVGVLVTSFGGGTQTVVTNASGNWSAQVVPGDTTVNVDETDPDFTALLPGGNFLQSAGTDPSTTTAVANVVTFAGNDGYFVPATVTGRLYLDVNGLGTQDPDEPGLPNVNVVITDSLGGTQTVVTNASGDWIAKVVAGSTTANVDETDPDYLAHVPPGSPRTEGTDPTTVTAVLGSTVSAGNDAWTLSGNRSISGQVRDDFDADGALTDNDTPVSGVTMKLWLDFNTNGLIDAGDTLMDTQVTDFLGSYSFPGLPDGRYLVQEINPLSSTSTADTGGANDDLIPVTIAGANSVGNDFLDAVDPSGYIYDSITGAIVPGGTIGVAGPGFVTVLMNGSTGQYSWITDGTPGTYFMTFTPPPGYVVDPTRPELAGPLDPTGGPNPYVLGSQENGANPGYLVDHTGGSNPYYMTFTLAPGDPVIINNNLPVRLTKATDYVYWKEITPGSGSTPDSNDDCDAANDLLEYALCGDPATGVQVRNLFTVRRNPGTGLVDASFKRPVGTTDVTYTLQLLTQLSLSPGGWVATSRVPDVVNNGDGSETVTYTNLESDPLFTGLTTGFARLRVSRATAPAGTSTTETYGWTRLSCGVNCETYSMPYLKPELLTACIDSLTSTTLGVATSVGTASYVPLMTAGMAYYVEVVEGDHEGQRWEVDEAASTATSVAIDLASPLNTLPTLPPSLAADRIVLRAHWTFDELFSKSAFHGAANPLTADRVLRYDTTSGAFVIYWLIDNGVVNKWLLTGDAALSDQGTRIVDVAEGLYIHPRTTGVNVLYTGLVRSNDMARPVAAGGTLIGGGWPMDQSPQSRVMTVPNGFTGNRNPIQADKVLFWSGDTTVGKLGYESHFLLNNTGRQWWTPVGNASLTNEDTLPIFKLMRASLLQSVNGKADYLLPLPWTP